MGNMMRFDYYYGIEAEQFSFYRVPRLLIKDERFKELSSDAKLLCFQVLKADCRCTEKSHEDVSGAPESRTTGNAWENVSEKAGRSGYGSVTPLSRWKKQKNH